MRDLRHNCEVCGKKADFEIEKDNKDLSNRFCKVGTRVEYFCNKHLPKEAKIYWEEELFE